MSLIFAFVAVIIIFIVLTVIMVGGQARDTATHLDYKKIFSILSSTEKAFLETLEPLLSQSFRVFVKVRLADLIQIQSPPPTAATRQMLAKIGATTVDFVICNAQDLSVAGIIDLENKAYTSGDPEMPDAFIDKAAAAAGLPLLRLPARLQYDAEELANLLKTGIKIAEQQEVKSAVSQYGSCPTCGEPLMLLKAKYGENIGKYFLGCSNYPECKYLVLLNEGSVATIIQTPAPPTAASRDRAP